MALIDLELALQTVDPDLQPYDALQLRDGKIYWNSRAEVGSPHKHSSTDPPPPHPSLIVMDLDRSMGMYHLLVPGRHPPMSFVLAAIPVRRDVSMDYAEYHKHLAAFVQITSDGIGPCSVPDQRRTPSLVDIDQEWQRIGTETCRCVAHKYAERIDADDAV